MTTTSPSSTAEARRGGSAATGAFVLLTVLVTWLVVGSLTRNGLIILGVLAVTAAQVTLMYLAAGRRFVHASGVVVVLNLVGCLGYLYYGGIASEAAVSAILPEDRETYLRSIQAFAIFSAMCCAGSVAAGWATAPSLRRRGVDRSNIFENTLAAVGRLRARPLLFATVVLVPLVMLVVGYSPAGLVRRSFYLEFGGPVVLVVLGTVVAPVAFVLGAVLLFSGAGPAGRVFGAATTTGYFVVMFGMGTRGLALYPLLLLFAWLVGGGWRHRGAALAASAGALLATLWLLSLVLTLRYGNGAGWAPYLEFVDASPSSLGEINIAALAGNVLFSVPLTGTVIVAKDLPASLLYTALTPLPSSMTDWATSHTIVSLNPSTPYNGLGELMAHGVVPFVVVAFAVGAALTAAQLWNADLPLVVRVVSWLTGLGLAGALSLDLLQYNLRSGMRVVWYLLALSVVFHLVARFLDPAVPAEPAVPAAAPVRPEAVPGPLARRPA